MTRTHDQRDTVEAVRPRDRYVSVYTELSRNVREQGLLRRRYGDEHRLFDDGITDRGTHQARSSRVSAWVFGFLARQGHGF